MNTYSIRIAQGLAFLSFAFAPLLLRAAPFVQGSAINVSGTSLTVDVPPDGVFNCSSVFVGANLDLTFKANALNTPIFLVVTGDVRIDGRVWAGGAPANNSLGGIGGPGGFSGGMGGIAGGHTIGGGGVGPGGGRNTNGWFGGVYAYSAGANSNTYGNGLLFPLIGGSGGAGRNAQAGGYGGGGGGGAILISSGTRIIFSAQLYPNDAGIYARGGNGGINGSYGPGGSGGAIRLVAPVVSGAGYLDTSGGFGGQECCTSYPDTGSQGRIRIDCLDDYAYRALTIKGSFSRGTQMFAFRTNSPRLDVVEVADSVGTNRTMIPLETSSGVSIALPFGSPTNQVVKLRSENFTNDVSVRIAVTPDTGPALTFDGVIPNSSSPATNSFNVVIPAGTISRIDAWTR